MSGAGGIQTKTHDGASKICYGRMYANVSLAGKQSHHGTANRQVRITDRAAPNTVIQRAAQSDRHGKYYGGQCERFPASLGGVIVLTKI